jgi:hypothetical protein
MTNGRDITLVAKGLSKKISSSDFCHERDLQDTNGNGSDNQGKFVGLLNLKSTMSVCTKSSNIFEKIYAVLRFRQNLKNYELHGSFKSSSHGVLQCSLFFKDSQTLSGAWCTMVKLYKVKTPYTILP